MEAGQRPWLLRGAVFGLALVVGLIAWIASDDGGDEAAPAAPEARIVDVAELRDLDSLVGHPVYWAGPQPRTVLELVELAEGGVQIRYLDEGAAAGDEADVLTVGSYPLPDPAAALAAFAAEPGSLVDRVSGSGLEVVRNPKSSPNSVYFVSPDNSVQVEVYDPLPWRARGLALTDRVRPAG